MKDNDVNGNHIHHMVTSSGQNIHEEQVNFDRHQVTAQQQDFSIIKCKNKKCLTCPELSTSKYFHSNITKKRFEVVNHSVNNISCKSQNLIYLLTCDTCNMQYVGETTTALNLRINNHRKSKKGCEHIINHNEYCSNVSFNIQVLEIFSESGYIDKIICPKERENRLNKEDFWIKTLRTVYPYGLNERVRDRDNNLPIGRLFPSIIRNTERSIRIRNRNKNKQITINSLETFFKSFFEIYNNNIKDTFYETRVILNKLKKKILSKIVLAILNRNPIINFNIKYEIYYEYIVDVIDTKIYHPKPFVKKIPPKYICTVNFENKAIENIKLSKILHDKDIIKTLPNILQDEVNVPLVTYKLDKTIRNKILNYNEVIKTTTIEENNSLNCDCANSKFCNPSLNHIITGDLRLVENGKLRKLLSKGTNYREPKKINFKKALTNISLALSKCINSFVTKTALNASNFDKWKDAVINKVKLRISTLKKKHKPKSVKSTLSDPEVLSYLEKLHKKYVIVYIDKAANNFAFICKKYYMNVLFNELNSNTYTQSNKSIKEIVNNNVQLCKDFGHILDKKDEKLPNIYWIPKLHKNPIGNRFIIASKRCSTKPLTKTVSKIFKMIFSKIENFHHKGHFYSKVKKFWVVENYFPIIAKLNKINDRNNANCISTFDFETLYTKIPHNLLIKVLENCIEFVFNWNKNKIIKFSSSYIFWSSENVGKNNFTKQKLIDTVSFLIKNCYFSVGNLVFKQVIGIPMGIDPAPFWANLFLYHFEHKHIKYLESEGSSRVFKYHGIFRYIDDLCAINDGNEFNLSFRNIYPHEMELNIQHYGTSATFLDLDITILDNKFVYKIYDKREDFPFSIVKMPFYSSNIPSHVFYGSIFSEFLRISRCTLLYKDLIPKFVELYIQMKNQGGNNYLILNQIKKISIRYPHIFGKFNKNIHRYY